MRELSSSSSSQRLSSINQLPPSLLSSQRLASYRGFLPQQILLNKTGVLNKKVYVPNLFVSRNVPPKLNIEGNVAPVPVKNEPRSKESRRGRREQKLLAPVETFVPESKCKVTGANLGVKMEIDRKTIKKVLTDQLPTKFEGISSAPSQDLPVSIPRSCLTSLVEGTAKMNPLLTDIMKSGGGESPLYLLRTPRYIPAMLDDSKNNSKAAKENKPGCTVHDLLEGQIGKLQILKSGKLRLVLGECKFWLHKGVKVNFREELAVVKIDTETKTGDIISLGEINERIMVIPDILTKLN